MSPDDDIVDQEDPDLVAERIIASLTFLIETAEKSGITYLQKPMVRCLSHCQEAYLKDQRRRFPQNGGPKPPKKSGNGQ
jgi:hypothetical protein